MSDIAEMPGWARELRSLFRSGAVGQFILHGNIFDLVPAPASIAAAGSSAVGGTPAAKRFVPLKQFLEEVMFGQYDVVIHYDRGKGIRAARGGEDFGRWLESLPESDKPMLERAREPARALEIIDRYLLRTLNLQALARGGNAGGAGAAISSTTGGRCPEKIAVIVDFAQFVVPAGNALQLGGDFATNVVKVLTWANDPAILQSNIITVLLTEQLNDLNEEVVGNPHPAKLKIPLPEERDMVEYLQQLSAGVFPDLGKKCEVPVEVLARRLTGLSRSGARTVIGQALTSEAGKITSAWLTGMKKEAIERETNGLLEFVESGFTLENLAGSEAIKAWLRADAALLKKGAINSLPMGYLISGRIGTGKTFLVNCWAGELGVPCVVLKNFRDKWVGATESNLEKIFTILRALGQVVVFVDEADQITGKRDGGGDDSGLSGRVYAMLAKEMSDTRNRGKIIWVFATSRPDLVEVDLKRPGRLDVHFPMFAPQTALEMKGLFVSVAKKFGFPLPAEDIPEMPVGLTLAGNEIEGLLVRVMRQYELADGPGGKPVMKDLLAAALKDVRANPNVRKLEYMDLVAVKECTDNQFLPEAYRAMPLEVIERRLAELREYV